MKIALIGGTGRLARSLIKYIHTFDKGVSFNILGRRNYKEFNNEFTKHFSEEDKYFEVKDVELAIESSDCVILLIPSSGINYAIHRNKKYLNNIVLPFSKKVIDISCSRYKYLIVFSSGAVYDERIYKDCNLGPNESSKLLNINTSDIYARAKLIQEDFAKRIYENHSLSYAILRIFSISDYLFKTPTFAIEEIVYNANKSDEEPLEIFSPYALRNYVSSFDLSRFVYKLLINKIQGIYNICGDRTISILDLAKLAINESGSQKTIKTSHCNNSKRNSYFGDGTKMIKSLENQSIDSINCQIQTLTARVQEINKYS